MLIKLSELIDIPKIQKLFDQLTETTGIRTALLDYPSQEVLVATGWCDLCTQFHRINAESSANCKESDHYLSTRSKETTEPVVSFCNNGLVDGCIPVVVDGDHMATVFSGQIFFEKPDEEKFRQQAKRYGFDEQKYLEALKQVPVLSEETFISHLNYLKEMSLFIAETAMTKKQLIQQNEELQAAKEELLQQNEELQGQEEELRQQNEELQGQEEELRQQNEELITKETQTLWYQAFLMAAIEQSKAGIHIASVKDLSIITTNRAAEEIVGQNRADFMRLEIEEQDLKFKCLYPDGSVYKLEDFPIARATLKDEVVINEEMQIERPDGTKRWIISNAAPIKDPDGNTIAGIVIFVDVTKQKEAEETLRMTQYIVDNSPVAKFIVDENGKILYANKTACKSLGYSAEELTQITVNDFDNSIAREDWENGWKILKESKIFTWQSKIRRKDGSLFPAETIISYYHYKDKKFALGYMIDITERKKLEKELEDEKLNLEKMVEIRTQELNQSLKELGVSNLELSRANKQTVKFLSTMSHELRTPLNAILGFSQSLEKQYFGPLTDKQLDYVCMIHNSGQHLLALINDLLDISKIEAGTMDVNIEKFQAHDLVDEVLQLMMTQIDNKDLILKTQFISNLPEIQADKLRFKQILLNLLSNAIKFTPEGGKIALKTELYINMVKISVSDTGIGLQEEEKDKIFTEFYQTDYTRTQAIGGTGIGLALCKHLVEMQGGTINFESEYEKGSTFWFMMPIAPDL